MLLAQSIEKLRVRVRAAVESTARWLWTKPAVPVYARMRFRRWFQLHFVGTVVLVAFAVVFFRTILVRLDSYIPGGDPMFNAWTLGRLHHCLMGQGCSTFADGNIFFPNHFSMVYSETQLSAGVLTLPFFWINPNPIFSFNVWTILSYGFSSWFMYFLAMYISRNIRWVSIMAGLVFGYAPIKVSALGHLQNLSIFYLPLAVLFIAKYLRSRRWRYLAYLLVTLVLFFYASWYQMVFGLIVIVLFLIGVAVFRVARLRSVLWAGGAVVAAIASTLPLMLQYAAFSTSTGAKYGLLDQALYSTHVVDYVLPFKTTWVGKIAHKLFPELKFDGFNPDSSVYAGIVLYAIALFVFIGALIIRKRSQALRRLWRWAAIFGVIVLVGFLCSLGPLLQVYDTLTVIGGQQIPMPWMLVDQFVPQLGFIRAIGRASIIVLFALCVLLAMLPAMVRALRRDRGRARVSAPSTPQPSTPQPQSRSWARWWRPGFVVAVVAVVGLSVDIMPVGHVPMTPVPNAYHITVPQVYKVIRDNPEINNIVVIFSDPEYPDVGLVTASVEPVLWAGYHNKHIFNGYSGYTPPGYAHQIDEFNRWTDDPVGRMRGFGLRYVLVDLDLSRSRPDLAQVVEQSGLTPVYRDLRYVLLKLPA